MSTTLQTSGIGSVYIQNLAFSGNSIIATNTNGSIDFVPNGTGAIGFGNVGFNNGVISTTLDNLDIVLSPNGTGTVKTDNLQLDGNTISTTNVDGNLVLTPNGNGNVGIGNSSPNAKLHVQGSFMQNDTLSYFVRKTMPSVSLLGTYNYVLLGKAATVSGVNMPASYAIGKIVFRRGDTNAYNFVDVINVMSSRGYDNETFSANIEHCGTGTTPSNVPNGTKFVRLVKCTYNSIEYHAVEITGSGGNNTHEQTFEGYSVDAGLLYVGEGLVSNVTSYGNLGVVSHTNGNVGVGTSSPGASLEVYKDFNGQSSGSTSAIIGGVDSGVSWSGVKILEKGSGLLSSDTKLINVVVDSSSKFVVTGTGSVGIGTTSPNTSLHVDGYQTFYDSTLLPGQNTTGSDLVPSKIILANEYGPQIRTRYPNGAYTDGVDLEFWTAGPNTATDSSSSRLTIRGYTGNVGVGTNDPKAKVHINGGGGVNVNLGISANPRAYFRSDTSLTLNWNVWNMSGASLYASADIVGSSWFISHGSTTFSDTRIKKDIVDIDDDSALHTIRLIKPKKYSYVDTVSKGSEPVWGFIAQEVKSTLDYAVNLMEKAIPNIYCLGNVLDNGNIIEISNFNTANLQHKDDGTLITKLQLKSWDNQEIEVEINSVLSSSKIRLTKPLEENVCNGTIGDEIIENQIFVYGQWVDDFHVLKKDAIFTVSVAALQEVDRRQVADNERILELEGEVSLLKEENNLLKQQLASIASRLSAAGL